MEVIAINEYPILKIKEERDFILQAQNGDKKAFDYLVLSNGGLVWSIAKKFKTKGIDQEDLYQTGVMGLMKAIDRYDLKQNVKLSTYAFMWIQQYIVNEIKSKSRAIRVPYGLYQKNFDLIIQNTKLEQELGKAPTIEELAEYTGHSIKEIKKFKSFMIDVCSLDQTFDTNDKSSLAEAYISDKGSDIGSEIISNRYVIELINTIKSVLTLKEYTIFIQHSGLENRKMTFDEIAVGYSLTKQRIQQIYSESIKKLKRNSEIKLYKCS